MQCTLPCPCRRLYLRMLVLLKVLVMTSMDWAPAPEIVRMKSSMPFSQNLYTSKRRSLKFQLLTTWMSRMDSTYHENTWDFCDSDLQRWNRISAPSLHVCASFETYAPSASNVSGSARSWPALEHVDGSHSRRVPWPRII